MLRIHFILAAACALAFPALAQHQHGTPAPAAPSVSAPKPPTASAPARVTTGLESYRPFKVDEPLIDWRATNNTVQTIGGWRSYAKEAMQANAASGEKK